MDRKSSQSRERATSHTRLFGFEPVGETVEDTLNNNFQSKTQKTRQTVERQGRSQAVKKVSKQGANLANEEVILLASNIDGKENSANESIEFDNLSQANSSKLTVITDEGNTMELTPRAANVQVQNNIVPPPRKETKNDKLIKEQHNEENNSVSLLDHPGHKEDESELPHLEPQVDEKEKDKSTKENTSKQNILTEKSEEAPFGIQLKKAELKQKTVAGAELQTPNLRHHEFESVAQCTDTEQGTNINLTRRIPEIRDMREEPGKTTTDEKEKLQEFIISENSMQKEEENTDEESGKLEPGIHSLKFSQKLKADEILIQNSEDKINQDSSEVEPVNTIFRKPLKLEHENQDFELTVKRKERSKDKGFNSEECLVQTIKMPKRQPISDVDEKMHNIEETTKTIQIDEPLVDDVPLKNGRKKKEEPQNEEQIFKQGLKLRKTETVKRPIKTAVVEVPKLKHHTFENVPKNVIEEQYGDIRLSRFLPQVTKKKKKKHQSKKEMEEEHPQEISVIDVPDEKIELKALSSTNDTAEDIV